MKLCSDLLAEREANISPVSYTHLFLVLPLSFYRQTDIFAITLEQTEQTMSLKKNQIFETTIENPVSYTHLDVYKRQIQKYTAYL